MKATGIVRRIDDLGRVVIPKEIRRTMRIRESEPLEIFTGREGEIILKKYSPISEMTEVAKHYVDSLSQVCGRIVMVADRDKIIAAGGGGKAYLGKELTKELEERMEKRDSFMAARDDRNFINIIYEMPIDIVYEAAVPILSAQRSIPTARMIIYPFCMIRLLMFAGDRFFPPVITAKIT